MPSLTVEPSYLGVPTGECDYECASTYVERLLDWSHALDEGDLHVYMSARTSEVLFTLNLYSFESVRQLLTTNGVREYDANTVDRVVMHLLQITPTFEEVFGLQDVLAGPVTTVPEILEGLPEDLANEIARIILMTSILRNHAIPRREHHALVIKDFKGHGNIQVRAHVEDVESAGDLNQVLQLPRIVEGSVWACESFRDLIQSCDEGECFSNLTPNSLRFAIRAAICKARHLRGEQSDWNDVPNFVFHHRFVDSVRDCLRHYGAGAPARLLRACVETLEQQNLGATHAIRVNEGPNAAQQRRGEDRAWRRDVDHELHLHYWQSPGQVEFAILVQHNEFGIPQ